MEPAIKRAMPETWFRAQHVASTMVALNARSFKRIAPLGPGERQLGVFVLPPFQRPPVWTREQQVKFLESCWLGLPIGVYVFNRTQNDGPYDGWLLDGQQRVTSVYAYMDDEFPVFGYRFSELPIADRRKWDMAVAFPAMYTQLETEAECREVYERLAYGGTAHEPPA